MVNPPPSVVSQVTSMCSATSYMSSGSHGAVHREIKADIPYVTRHALIVTGITDYLLSV